MNQAQAAPHQIDRPGLKALGQRIGLLERSAAPTGKAPLTWGIEAIDRHLPAGGLDPGALHEVTGPDLEEAGLAAGIVTRLLGQAQAQRPGHVLWVARQRDLYVRALPGGGCDPARLVHLLTRRNADSLWALEEALRVPGLAAVVGEVGALDLTQSRRLQLAAEKGGVPAFIIRRGRNAAQARLWFAQPIAAQTRWCIHPVLSPILSPILSPGQHASTQQPPLPGPARWRIELWRCRGGRPGSWIVEETEHGWREAALSLPLSAALAERPLVAPPHAGGQRKTG